MSSILLHKIKDKTAKIAVVGLGYVGLPLAVQKAKTGFTVIGIERKKERVDMVNEGKTYLADIVGDELEKVVKEGKLKARQDFSPIAEVDIVSLCVPTPLTKNKEPDTQYIESVTDKMLPYLHKDQLVILESTTYPGTTEEIILPKIEDAGFKVGKDIYLAYSPERIDPGNKKYRLNNIPKVVGGVTLKCTQLAKALYQEVIQEKIHTVSSPKVAEMEKLLENVFRNVNIALANELAILCYRMGINIWEVIEAAKTKPYGFMPFYPGPGLGGHCFEKNQKVFIKKPQGKIEIVEIGTLFSCYELKDRIQSRIKTSNLLFTASPKRKIFSQTLKSDISDFLPFYNFYQVPCDQIFLTFPKDLEVLSFDLGSKQTSFQKGFALSKRRVEKIRVIEGYYGYKLKVTEDHPVITYKDNNFQIKQAKEITKNDNLLLSRQIPSLVTNKNIDLIEAILTKQPFLVDKVRIKPVEDKVKDFRKYINPYLKGKAKKYDFYRYNYLPLSLYLELEEKIDLKREKIDLVTGKGPSYNEIPAILRIDKDFARLVGYYLSEGCITKESKTYRLRFTFCAEEIDYIKDLTEILNRKGIKYSIWKDKKWNNCHIKVSSYLLGLVFEKILNCGKNCYEMQIPWQIFFSTPFLRKEVLKGLFRGDGGVYWIDKKKNYRKNEKTYSHHSNSLELCFFTSSPSLFEQVQLILLELGIVGKFHRREGLLRIHGPDNIRKFVDVFAGKKREKIKGYLKNIKKEVNYNLFEIFPEFVAIKIKKVYEKPVKEVYSLEVEKTNTFLTTSGIIVHNCIPVDPFYLAWKAKEYAFNTRFIELAGEINDRMPYYIVERVTQILNREKKCLNGAHILLLGVAYKKDVGDLRESPVLKIIDLLEKEGTNICYNDPYVPSFSLKGKEYRSIKLDDRVVKKQDLVIITTDHSLYDYQKIVNSARLIFDTRNATKNIKNGREKIHLL